VSSETQPNGDGRDQTLIPDLRDITLGQLAERAADGEKDVTDVVSRIVTSRGGATAISAMTFNSAV
jgi:hypothetical protein